MDVVRAAYDEIYVYAMGRPGFILQHVIDAYAVQTAAENPAAIGLVFGLAGLYLHVEKQFSGRQVQQAHQKLGARKRLWPVVVFPEARGHLTACDVLAAPAGRERDAAIEEWCRSVWGAFSHNRRTIVTLLEEYRLI